MRKIIPPELHTEVIARYTAGDRPKNIAAALGLNDWNVSVIVRRAGCARRASDAQQLILSRGEWIGNRKYPVRDDAFSTITPESAYWCGFLMADGSIAGNKVRLKLAPKDIEHIEKFRTFMRTDAPITIKGANTNGTIGGRAINSTGEALVVIASERVVRDLAYFGVIPRKSLIAKVHHLDFNRDFWRGVIDGNGSLIRSGGVSYLSLVGSEALVTQFLNFCKSIVETNVTVRPTGRIYKVYMNGRAAIGVIANLYRYAAVSLDRKASKAASMIDIHG